MKWIEWTEELSLGIEEIDEQHKQLVALANGLANAVDLGRKPRVINNVLTKLREYTVFHFHSEEQFMGKVRYPLRGEHALEHLNLKEQVKQYRKTLFYKEKLKPATIVAFVKVWLIKHIMESDMQVAEFIKQQQAEKEVEEEATSTPPEPEQE